MRLPRLIKLPVIALIAFGCSDGTAPPPSLAQYRLESINSQQVPTTVHARDGYTVTVIWSTLTLDITGRSELVERVRYTFPDTRTAEETQTRRYSYQITGDDVSFDHYPPCPPNALCVAPPSGRFVGSTLILTYSGDNFSRSDLYRLGAAD